MRKTDVDTGGQDTLLRIHLQGTVRGRRHTNGVYTFTLFIQAMPEAAADSAMPVEYDMQNVEVTLLGVAMLQSIAESLENHAIQSMLSAATPND